MAEKDLSIVGYVLGILSIIFGLVSPLAGLAMGIIGLVNSGKHKSELSKKAKIMSIIGIVLSVVVFAVVMVASYVYNGVSTSASSLLSTTP